MKKLLRHTLTVALVLLTAVGLSSCEDEHDLWTVSYTHLTLPTICSV